LAKESTQSFLFLALLEHIENIVILSKNEGELAHPQSQFSRHLSLILEFLEYLIESAH
jgi:hypothetical protein